jgi:hypothetical protein
VLIHILYNPYTFGLHRFAANVKFIVKKRTCFKFPWSHVLDLPHVQVTKTHIVVATYGFHDRTGYGFTQLCAR